MTSNKTSGMIKLKTATKNDLNRILELQKRAFYGQGLIYDDFNLPSLMQTIDDIMSEFRLKTFYKVEIEGEIIGSIRCRIKDATLYIEKLMVEPDVQNRGIGTEIMHEIERRYSTMVRRYEVATGHRSARNLHLYKKIGYKEIGRERLTDSCDMVIMEKIVDEKAE